MDNYKIVVSENRMKSPYSKEECLVTTSVLFASLHEAADYISKNVKFLRNRSGLLREWHELTDNSVVIKMLFKDYGGRVLCRYELIRIHLYDDNPWWDD